MIKTDNVMEKVIKHCLSLKSSKEELECFNKNYAPFLYMVDKKRYWKVVEVIKATHNFTLQTILEKKEGKNIEDIDKDCDLNFKHIDKICFQGDPEQKEQIRFRIDRVYINIEDDSSIRIMGDIQAGFSVDCEMIINFYNNNKKIIKENDYFELFVEEQGVFEVDIYISESEEIIRNISEVEIICKYT